MPYKQITQLPDNVKNNLPKHAQEIYKEAFNSAEDQYGEEDRAHRVACRREQIREGREGQLGLQGWLTHPRKTGEAGVPRTGALVLLYALDSPHMRTLRGRQEDVLRRLGPIHRSA
jgi:cation transport regulator